MAVTFGGPKVGWAVGLEEVSRVILPRPLKAQQRWAGVDTAKGHHWALMGTGSVTWRSLSRGFLPLLSIPFRFLQEQPPALGSPGCTQLALPSVTQKMFNP